MNNLERITKKIKQNAARYEFIDGVTDIVVYGSLDDLVETRNIIIEEFNKNIFEEDDMSLLHEAIDLLKEKFKKFNSESISETRNT